ncbi:MFS general substrate transporter [Mycena kentingensis (nom. inval.)]|nr:MFS general substrate transporter [Mycena kentingensis (nom. inval.)]
MSSSPSSKEASSTLDTTPPAYDFNVLPIPQRLRYDPTGKDPFRFGIVLNVLFGFASTFIVANLYYCQPLLRYQHFFKQGTKLFSAGDVCSRVYSYATGILFISPLGDLVRRRGLILFLALISSSLTIGLAVTSNLIVFEVLSFIIGVVSVTPQIMIPLAADLAPPERRATAVSVVYSGLAFGILIARVLAGIIAQYVSWRVVYYFAIGVQCLVFVAGYFLIPDYPAKNPQLSYFGILRTMAVFAYTEPVLIQACLVNLASCACFTNFWVTLTFLLGGPPYNYSTLTIGLFGVIGIFGVACGPFAGRVIDRLIPWYASLAGVLILLCVQAIQVGAGDKSPAVIVVVIMGLDVFRQALQMSLAASYSFPSRIDAAARARLNALFVLSLFIGQLMGTSAGTKVYTAFGWRAAAALNIGFYAWVLIIIVLRGPHCARYTWVGYEGGLTPWKRSQVQEDSGQDGAKEKEKAAAPDDLEAGKEGQHAKAPQADPEAGSEGAQYARPDVVLHK